MGKILVLGATSFSGNSLANRLKDQDDLMLLGRNTHLPRVFDAMSQKESLNSEIIQWNINDNHDDVLQTIKNENVTEVINFAAQSMVGESWENPEDWYEANVLSFANFIKGIARIESIRKF